MKKSIAINIILTIVIIILSIMLINNYKKINKLIRNKEEHKVIVEKNKLNTDVGKNENILFFGDSITEIYPIDDIFCDYKIIGSGKSGYTTNDLIDKVDDMLCKYNPTKVILLIGTNDIMKDVSEEKQKETVDNIKKLIKIIKEKRPKAKLYIESLYPVNRNMNKEMVNNRTNESIKNINSNLEKYCNKEKITYIDMYSELVDENGNFDEKYTYDGLHPSTLGYAKISKILTPYVYE